MFTLPIRIKESTLYLLPKRFVCEESGQGITEYGAILAFVALLIALVYTLTSGHLAGAISQAFSAVVAQLNNLSAAAAGSASS